MKILVAVNTCHKTPHVLKAAAQRRTWVPGVRALGFEVVFFRGRPPADSSPFVGQDEVWLFDCDDSYAGISKKVQRIFAWAKDHGYDYVLKVDDDVYIVPQRLQFLVFTVYGKDYVGRFRGPYGNYPPHFASGFAYWLSCIACHMVAATPHNGDWMDERFVATALAHRGVYGHTDLQSYCVTGPHLSAKDVMEHPTLGKGTIFCEYGAAAIEDFHRVFADATPVLPLPEPQRVPECFVDVHKLHEPPADRIPEGKLDKWKYQQ